MTELVPAESASNSLEELTKAARKFLKREDRNPGGLMELDGTLKNWSDSLIPRRFSYVGSDVLSHTRDQGNWFACTSFALTAAIECCWRKKQGGNLDLVPGHLHNCLAQRTDPNMGLDAGYAADLCEQFGVLNGRNDSIPVSAGVCANLGPRTKVSSATYLSTVDETFASLTSNGPLLVDMWVPIETFFRHTGDTIFNCPDNPPDSLLHSLLLVGYNVEAPVKYAIVQHSGGVGWGVGGIGKIRLGAGGLLSQRRPLRVSV